jgi:hypothetical protein
MRTLAAHQLAIVVFLLLLCGVATSGQKHGLTSEDIAEAIKWGRSGHAEAYVLKSPFLKNKTAPGVVYTPYLRVALAARAAADSGKQFAAEDVTKEMTAPLLWFALGDHGNDPLPSAVMPPDTPVSMRLVTHHSTPGSPLRQVIPASWVRFEVPSYLRYGLRPDWSYAVGAFPIEHVTADTRVELYREHREGSHLQVLAAPGLVSQADLQAWR